MLLFRSGEITGGGEVDARADATPQQVNEQRHERRGAEQKVEGGEQTHHGGSRLIMAVPDERRKRGARVRRMARP